MEILPFETKSTTKIQIAAITEENPNTNPTNNQILAPRAPINPPP